jgi:two-component system, NtrC family, response regulator AtoC
MDQTVLLVDDEQNARDALSLAIKRDGYSVIAAANGKEGIDALASNPVDIIITDLIMPEVTGMEVLRYARRHHPNVMVIMITGYASVETAIEALKEGAFDYITKPIKLDEVKITLKKASENRNLLIENLLLKQQLKGKYTFDNIIGNSSRMQDMFKMMEKVLDTESTVLIRGDSGTGKELVARAIHYNGPRKDKPFVAINCAAIPNELLESELFGHVKGSFTGATANKAGKFEIADTGTIFLDEIGSMSTYLQGKILRVLQEKEFERVGGSKPVKVDVRILSATNVDLEKAVREGSFREDLFYRLNVIPIYIPSLKQRVDDIPLLVAHFIRKFNEKTGRNVKGLASGVMDNLTSYTWPGNVRELENVIERAATLTESEYIGTDALPHYLQGENRAGTFINPWIPDKGTDLSSEVERFEKTLITMALDKAGGVKSRAAELLNIKRTTLVEKMKRLNL